MNQTVLETNSQHQNLLNLRDALNKRIIGQKKLVDRLLIALLADGHLLVEGAPGLAKTKAIKCLAAGIEGDFHRIQFTPDLLPSDLTGTDIFRAETGQFEFQPGPIFHNLLLADEINRAPAKVQSALLEAMAERQSTIGQNTYALPDLFLVMATQNPIEQEGTYPLPEAQLDRFLMYVKIDYPNADAEKTILKLARMEAAKNEEDFQLPTVQQKTIFAIRRELYNLHINPTLEQYMVQVILATRKPENYDNNLATWLRYGASPRATIALDRCARAHAWLNHRDYVTPEDIHAVVFDVLRHRIVLTFAAEAEGMTTDKVIRDILDKVPLPS